MLINEGIHPIIFTLDKRWALVLCSRSIKVWSYFSSKADTFHYLLFWTFEWCAEEKNDLEGLFGFSHLDCRSCFWVELKKDKCIHSSYDPWLYMDFELENTRRRDERSQLLRWHTKDGVKRPPTKETGTEHLSGSKIDEENSAFIKPRCTTHSSDSTVS